MSLIRLTYGSGVEFHLNSDRIESLNWDPARNETVIVGASSRVYHSVETPHQINALINGHPKPLTNEADAEDGVGGRGPVHGDGSPMETRGPQIPGTWSERVEPQSFDPFGAFGNHRRQ